MFVVKPIRSKLKYIVIVLYIILGLLVYTSIVIVLTRRVSDSTERKDSYTRKIGENDFSLLGVMARAKPTVNKSPRILCYILLSRKKLIAAKVIRETWGSRCDKLIFFGRFKSTDVKITFLNVTEGYPYLWGKTKAALLHLDREYSNQYDWFIKADDDTFLVVENLRSFVSNLNSTRPLWFGYKLRDKNMEQGYLSGGAGYGFSKSGLHNIVSLLESNVEGVPSGACDLTGAKGYEDLELGKCAILAGIEEAISTDTLGRERFLPVALSSLLNSDMSRFHWIWDQAWNPITLGEKCCSQNLISMHQISPNEMRTLYYIIYHLKMHPRHI